MLVLMFHGSVKRVFDRYYP